MLINGEYTVTAYFTYVYELPMTPMGDYFESFA